MLEFERFQVNYFLHGRLLLGLTPLRTAQRTWWTLSSLDRGCVGGREWQGCRKQRTGINFYRELDEKSHKNGCGLNLLRLWWLIQMSYYRAHFEGRQRFIMTLYVMTLVTRWRFDQRLSPIQRHILCMLPPPVCHPSFFSSPWLFLHSPSVYHVLHAPLVELNLNHIFLILLKNWTALVNCWWSPGCVDCTRTWACLILTRREKYWSAEKRRYKFVEAAKTSNNCYDT